MRTVARPLTHLVHIRGEGLSTFDFHGWVRCEHCGRKQQRRQSHDKACSDHVGKLSESCGRVSAHRVKLMCSKGLAEPLPPCCWGSLSPVAALFALHFRRSLRDGVLYWHARYELAKGHGLCLTARFMPDFPPPPSASSAHHSSRLHLHARRNGALYQHAEPQLASVRGHSCKAIYPIISRACRAIVPAPFCELGSAFYADGRALPLHVRSS